MNNKVLKRIISFMLFVCIIFSGICLKENILAKEEIKTKFGITEEQAKKLGITLDDIEFSNIDLNSLNSYLSQDVKLLGYGPMIGIATESIETRTFTRYELKEIKKAQKYIRDYYIGNIGKETLKDYLSSFAGYTVSFLLGRLDIIDRQNTAVMLRWISDGIDLIDKALDTGRSRVTMKFMRLTWKTTGFSVITGGIILR